MPDPALTPLRRFQALREKWLRLDDQREVRVRRPTPVDRMTWKAGDNAASLRLMQRYVVDWRGAGFTEAGIYGAAQASPVPVPFDAALWAEMADETPDWAAAVAVFVVQMFDQHDAAVQDAAEK